MTLEKRERTGSERPVPSGFPCLMIQKEMPFLKYDSLLGKFLDVFLQ